MINVAFDLRALSAPELVWFLHDERRSFVPMVLYGLAELIGRGIVERRTVAAGVCPSCNLSYAWDGVVCYRCKVASRIVLPRPRMPVYRLRETSSLDDLPAPLRKIAGALEDGDSRFDARLPRGVGVDRVFRRLRDNQAMPSIVRLVKKG